MTSAGGPGYKWRGKNIRCITRKNIDCVAMPRKDSVISIPAEIKKDRTYIVNITAKNLGGNGLISATFTSSACKSEEKYVKSNDFESISLKVMVESVSSKKCALEIYKPPKSSGNLLISSVNFVESITIPVKDISGPCDAKIIDKNKIRVIADKQRDLEKIERINKLEKIIKSRNYSTIGSSSSFQWPGKNIKNVFKYGTNCALISQQDSVILIPVTVEDSSIYRVAISAFKTMMGANVELMMNFFAGKSFNGPAVSIKVSGSTPREYSVSLTSPETKGGVPVYLRIWKTKDSAGSVLVRDVKYNLVSKIKKTELTKKNAIYTTKEDVIMKYRPFESISAKLAEAIKEVLIIEPNRVPKVSIITPTRNGKDLIEKCWNALNANTAYPNWEWIVGDSNSGDGTTEFIKKINDPRIKLIERNTTEGSFSSINNELVKYSDADYLLFLNNDTEPKPFWLYNMMSKIHNHSEIGIVGAKLLYSEGRVQHAGIAFMNEGPGNLSKAVLKSFPKDFDKYDRFYQSVTAACLLVRRKDFDEVGGFDPIYYFCYEDVDLCLKINKTLNKKVVYAANAEVIHSESITQNKFKTSGEKQKIGIDYFKNKWMPLVEKDFYKHMKSSSVNRYDVDVSFVTCVNNIKQYSNYVVASIFNSSSKRNYEIIPIFNFGNKYSAAAALNIGISKARANVVVLCHQDIVFYKEWVDMLFSRIKEIEKTNKRWGVLGTAGITRDDDTIGVVRNMKGSIQWQSTKRAKFYPVQTVDEHCIILRKDSGLVFDSNIFSGFHFYGPDICLSSISRGFTNYGILCPLVHDSNSGSLSSGKKEFMHYLDALNKKWGSKFKAIRTPTSIIQRGTARTFIKFK